jgi:hypothetical protein
LKRTKKNVDDLVTEHLAVTKEVFTFLWRLKIQWHCGRLNDVIVRLAEMAGF